MLVHFIQLRYHFSMPGERLHHLIDRLGLLLRADARRHDRGKLALQPVQRAVLEYLARCNRYSDTPAAVSEFLQLTKGTVSQTLGVLTRRGLIEKRSDSIDRRVVRLSLTPAGRRLAVARGKMWHRMSKALGTKGTARAAALLQDLITQAEKAAATRSFGECNHCSLLRMESRALYRCGLTGEALAAAETRQICREHVPAGGRHPAPARAR